MPFDKAKYWKEYKAKNAGRWSLKRSHLKPSQSRLKPVTKKRAKALREYEKEKKEFFKEATVCQFPGCESETLDLHHAAGRIGKNLTNRENFRGLCRVHHEWVELHGREAKELGLSKSRLAS